MTKRIMFVTLLFLLSNLLYGQNDTTIYLSDMDEYEIKYRTKINGVDSFLTITFIPSTKISPSIKCKVTKNNQSNEPIYNYQIRNEESSKQSLEFFMLEIDSAVNYKDKTINNWHFGRSARLEGYSWFGDDLLPPGNQQDGFAIQSSSLPGIGNSYFQGQLPFYTLSEEESSHYLEEVIDSLSRFPKNFVRKKTLVPVNLFGTSDLIDGINSVLAYCIESFTLNWIPSKQTFHLHAQTYKIFYMM